MLEELQINSPHSKPRWQLLNSISAREHPTTGHFGEFTQDFVQPQAVCPRVAGRSVFYLRENQQMRLALHVEEQKLQSWRASICSASPRADVQGLAAVVVGRNLCINMTLQLPRTLQALQTVGSTHVQRPTWQQDRSSIPQTETEPEQKQGRTGLASDKKGQSSSIQVWLLEIIRILDLLISFLRWDWYFLF